MSEDESVFYHPLVVGAPRTGFTLLITIVRQFYRYISASTDNRMELLRFTSERLGDHLYRSLMDVFEKAGVTKDLVFSPMFHPLIGGPKWIDPDDPRLACFRKYIGVRGLGDFSLITRHPRAVMNCDTVVHSHTYPALWPSLPDFHRHVKFASVRNPCGALNSAVFSINAIASEYIQKFLPPEKDNDLLRQHLAKFKLTHLEFFEGLVNFYSLYYKEFAGCREHFITMKWEDLIREPIPTILGLARAASLALTESQAREIWESMRYRNLTGPHRHNFRQGKGIVGDWQTSLLNEHLEIIKGSGIEYAMRELGYPPIRYLDESAYTPYQREIAGYLRRGAVFEDYPDQDLFIFDFQKSNLKWEGLLGFKEYPWRKWTRIERSCLKDETLVNDVWAAAENAIEPVNAIIQDILLEDFRDPGRACTALKTLAKKHHCFLQGLQGDRCQRLFSEATALPWKTETTPSATERPDVSMATPVWQPARTLDFVQDDIQAFVTGIQRYHQQGARNILLQPYNQRARQIAAAFANHPHDIAFFAPPEDLPPHEASDVVSVAGKTDLHATVICESEPEALANRLHRCRDMIQGTVLAPITERFSQKNPLFLVSIPKAGTHLLFQLARSLGYTDGLVLTEPARGGFWYFLEYAHAHTSARDFFIDSVRRAPFGNRRHPFRCTPTLFIYRNPLDILVSEASYYHQDGKTAFGGYLSELSLEERILRLIDDPWLLGSIRDRVGNFLAWLDFPNVAPVSFEELVGAKGGGRDDVARNLVWSVQLKLQAPGKPSEIAASLFDTASPTFRRGRLGTHTKYLTAKARERFDRLPQDFMEMLGYDPHGQPGVPLRAEEFSRRPLKLGKERHTDIPVHADFDFFGYDIIVFQGLYYAVPRNIPMIDFPRTDPARLQGLLHASDLTALRKNIIRFNSRSAASQPLLKHAQPIRSLWKRGRRLLEKFKPCSKVKTP